MARRSLSPPHTSFAPVPDPVLPPFPSDPLAPEASAPPVMARTPEPLALVDAWAWAHPFRLSGPLETGRFNPLLAALLVFIGAFVIFNIIGAIVLGIGLAIDISQGGEMVLDPEVLLTTHGGLLLGGNTIGQWVGFTLVALLMARLSTPEWKEFLRIRTPDLAGMGLAALGWAVFYPFVIWLGEVNANLPLPEGLREFDAAQSDMVEMLLMGTSLPTWFLFIAVAITPAICEELMFRGYLQRQVERGLGLVWSIVLVGVLFGLYHLQLTKALPLAALGVYLGFIVWATGSVWTGTLVHLLNNGLAVLGVAYVRSQPEMDMEAIDGIGVPWYLAAACLMGTLAVSYGIYLRRRSLVGETPDAAPSSPLTSPAPSYV